ncbi:PotD/PotF family extracellular solute-binding protein [Halosolutus amylolyticus]|uniref:PotD/PotF family extracellular solute-binding protein n=1 Tax=Halosolutus amylolyticus TaxID=2932267 RepID=A0ABD5PJA7_9EURY|nr:extracellular solute-binding protein [Halosolutus amylolyticus]
MHGEDEPATESNSVSTGAASKTDRTSTDRIGRRGFLAASGAGSVAAFAGCLTGGGDGSGGDETLRVAAWSGSYTDRFDEAVAKPFEEETGMTVEVLPRWSEIISQIRAAPADDPPYDVTVTDGFFYHEGRSDDLFEPVRYDNVPNIDEVFPYLREFRTDEYGVPVDGDPTSLAYLTEAVSEFSGWSDLTEISGLTMEGGFYVYPLQVGALMADEYEGDGELYDESTHDIVFENLRELDVARWYDSGADAWEFMRQGIADAAQYYGYQTAYDAREEQDLDLEVTIPDETGGFFNHYCVVRGTSNRDMAEEFLNHMLDAEVQTNWSEISGEVRSNQNTEYPDDVEEMIPTTEEELKNVSFPDWEQLSEFSGDLSERFEELKRETGE